MRLLLLIFISFSFTALNVYAASPYIEVKRGYKQHRIIPLPEDVSPRIVLLDSSFPIELRGLGLPRSVVPELAKIVVLCARNGDNPSAIRRPWRQFVRSLSGVSAPIDLNLLIQYILRRAYLNRNIDLQFYADSVRYYNDSQKSIIGLLNNLNYKKEACSRRLVRCSRATFRDIEQEIGEKREELDELRDDARSARLWLYIISRRQQQTLQTMSNISKMLHETVIAVIKK